MFSQRGFVLPSPTAIMAGVIIALTLSNILFIKLYEGAKDDLRTYQSAVEQAQKQVEADNERLANDQERILAEYGKRWADSVAYRESHPLVRVLHAECGVPESPALSASSGEITGAASQLGLSGEMVIAAAECERRLNWAAEDAAKVILLQDWATRQHEASK